MSLAFSKSEHYSITDTFYVFTNAFNAQYECTADATGVRFNTDKELTGLKLTVMLVYGALSCMAVSGFREDIIACVVLVLESTGAQHDTVGVLTGASG